MKPEIWALQERKLLGIAEPEDYLAIRAHEVREDGHIWHLIFFLAFAALFFL